MKLISNKPYDSLFVYFPSLEETSDWSEEKPFVCTSERITTPRGFTSFSASFYFVFKVNGGIDYVLSSENDDAHARILLYDFLSYMSSDLRAGRDALIDGEIGGGSSILVKMDSPTVLIARISPIDGDSNSLNKAVTINFSNLLMQIDVSPHYVRDWSNRIDGTCWNVAGKVYDRRTLSDVERRHVSSINLLEAWKHGVYAKAVEWNDHMGGTDGLKWIFEDCEDYSDNDVYSNVSFSYDSSYSGSNIVMQNPFGFENKKIAVKMETMLYSDIDITTYFILSGNGECHAEIGDVSVYCDFSETPIRNISNVHLKNGYNHIKIWYNSDKNDNDSSSIVQPWFWMTNMSSFISSNILFLPNSFNPDEYISFDDVFRNAKLRVLYENEYVTVPEYTMIPLSIGNTQHGLTVGMALRFPEQFDGTYGVLHGRGIRIYRIQQNVLRIECDGIEGHLEFPIIVNKWHSLFLMMDNTMICWYWDMNTNGIINANLNVLLSTDDMYFGHDENLTVLQEHNDTIEQYQEYDNGAIEDESLDSLDENVSGTFDLMSIVISDKIFRQGEVNRIYENWMKQ